MKEKPVTQEEVEEALEKLVKLGLVVKLNNKGVTYYQTKERWKRMVKGVPKKDGSGLGKRANKGRSGCFDTKGRGRG